MIKIGIIGCGRITQVRHAPEYAQNPDCQMVAFYDDVPARAQGLAKQYGGKACTSIEELLDSGLDAVSVCVANVAHAAVTIRALEHGLHVLCEKPMAATLAECEAMVKAADASGKMLMIDQNQRFAKAHLRAKKLIAEGAIGRVLTFSTRFGHGGPESWSVDGGKDTWFFDKNKAAMGAMADLGIHKTDLIQFLLDQTVTETTATITTLDKRNGAGELIGVDDNALCIYRMSGGAIGTMTASWTYYGAEDNSTVLYGTEGQMRIYDDPAYSIKMITRTGEVVLYDIDRIQTNDNQTKSGVIDAFVECLKTGEAPSVSGRSVLAAMRAVFASIRSSETGERVAVEQ